MHSLHFCPNNVLELCCCRTHTLTLWLSHRYIKSRLDVDKLDYLKRDNSACGELTTSEFSSLYENMKVTVWPDLLRDMGLQPAQCHHHLLLEDTSCV